MANQPEIADLVKDITADVTTIVKGQIELAKAELVPQAKSVGIGAGLFGAAGYLGVGAAGLIWISLSIGWGEFWAWLGVKPFASLALGFLTMAVIMLALAGVLALIGKNKVSVKGPEATVREGVASVEALVTAVERGKDTAEAEAQVRKATRKDVPMLSVRPGDRA